MRSKVVRLVDPLQTLKSQGYPITVFEAFYTLKKRMPVTQFFDHVKYLINKELDQ